MKFKLLNETTNNYGDVIKVGDIVKYTTRTDNWLHESVRGTNCGEVLEIRKYDDGKVYIRVSDWKLNTISSLFPNHLEVKESRKEKEIVITKDKFQEFRKMILENLGIVLKIVFGNKCLTHRFNTKDYMDYEPKNVTKEEYAMNMIERDIHEVYNIMTKGYVSVMTGNQLEKKDFTEKYNVSTLVSTDSNTEEKTHTEKMEEKQMNTINKNALNNRMTKLGEFLKENRDKDVVENKVYELFPNAIEVEVFNGDDVVYFLVGQDYVGKKPTKKEMKEQDNLFKEIDKMYGLSVYVSVNEEKIKIESSVGVDYRDIYNHTHYTDCTVKEIEIELDLTMEVAKELAEDIREQNDKGTLSACYSWNRINDLCKRNTTDEVLDFLESEKQYYNKKEEEERKQENIEYINKTINTSYQLFAEGTISVEKILEKLKKLEGYCHEYALLKKVEDARKLFERAEDSMWREVVRKEVIKILEEKYNQMLQEKIEILEKEVTSETTAEDAKEILGKLGKHIKKLYDIEHNGFCYETEPLLVTCYGVGGKENIPNGCDKVLYTRRLRYGIHLSESEEFISMYIVGDIVVEKDEDTKIYENRRIFYKEIPLSIEKEIENHINEVLELSIKNNNDVGYMYKKTIAVKKNDRYEFTSLFEDIWTGQDVYIGKGTNMIMIPNSSKSFLTDIVEDFLCSNIGINETVEKIKEKIKRKFEYSYSKSITVKEEEIYVLETPSDIELFWYYKDAYSRMVELVNEMSEKFSNNYEVTMDDYSAKMETFSWKITTKKIK